MAGLTWKGWYFVPTDVIAAALSEARKLAHKDHPDTPIGRMMTPHVREVATGWRVMVVGKPYDDPQADR